MSLLFDHDEGDIDLTLYGPTFSPVAEASTQTDDEVLSFEVQDTGRYFIVATMPADSGAMAGNAYTLQWQLGTTSTCATDAAEPNFSLSGAQALVPATLPDLQVCEDNPDYFVIAAPANNQLTVTALFDHDEGDIDLALLDFEGSVLTASASSTDDESAAMIFPSEEGVFIEVSLSADSGSLPGNGYTLVVAYDTPVCPLDSHEPDNDLASAALLPLGPNPYRSVCPGDEDWWMILGLAGRTLQVDVGFEQAEGDIDVELVAADGAVLESATSGSDGESLSYAVTTDAYVFVRVLLASDAGDPGNTFSIEYTLD